MAVEFYLFIYFVFRFSKRSDWSSVPRRGASEDRIYIVGGVNRQEKEQHHFVEKAATSSSGLLRSTSGVDKNVLSHLTLREERIDHRRSRRHEGGLEHVGQQA